MSFQVIGKIVERPLHTAFVAEAGRLSPKPRDPCRALPVVGEEPVHIGPGHQAVGGDGAVAALS